MKNKYWAFVVLVLGLVMSSPAFAVCSNNEDGEPGVAGEIEYFSFAGMLRYCDGTNWIDMVVLEDDVTDGLVSHWPFEETTGGTTSDIVGGFDGSFITGRTAADATTTGQIDNGFIFGNTNNHRIETTNNTFETNNNVTFSAWINNDVVGTGDYIILSQGDDAGNGGGAQYEFTLAVGDLTGGNDSNIQFHVEVDGTSGVDVDDIRIMHPFIEVGDWQHVVVTVADAGGATPTAVMYVNGTQVATDTAASAIPRGTWDKDFVIGAAPNGTRPFDGDIDEVRVYDRVLNADEVLQLYSFQAGIVLSGGNADCTAIGEVCNDGSVYAGISPDGNLAMYATPADAPSTIPWNDDNSTNKTDTGVGSMTSGATNTAQLILADSDSGTAGVQPHQAAQYCADLSAHGNDDWYLPAPDEMQILYDNRTAIGGFGASNTYWTSRSLGDNRANVFGFVSGSLGDNDKENNRYVRCVRRNTSSLIFSSAGLISWWKLDETGGTTVTDSIGPNNGTYSEAAIVPTTAVLDNALDFAATDDDVNAGNNASLVIDDGTITLWFKTPNSDVAANRYLVAKDASGNTDGDFGVLIKNSTDGGNPSRIELITNNGSSNNSIFSNSDISSDLWTHVAVNFGASGKRMYVNGVLQSDTDTNTTGMTNSAANFIIGNLRAGNTLDFDGEIDDVRVYNIALSADEIQAIFEEGLDGSSLVGHWKFDETSGTSVVDSSGNAGPAAMEGGQDAATESRTGVIDNALHTYVNGGSPNEHAVTAPLAQVAQVLRQSTRSGWFRLDEDFPYFGNRLFEYTGCGADKVFLQDSDELTVQMSTNCVSSSGWTTSGLNLVADEWYHFAVTFDYDNLPGKAILYINGSEVTLPGANIASGATPDTSTLVTLGNRGNQDQAIAGVMDDYRFYDRVLNADEVTALYNRGRDRGLVGHWRMDETTGTTVNDLSGANDGNGHDGTMTGSMNAANDSASGIFGTAFDFDGTNDNIDITDPGNLYQTAPLTLSGWFNMDQLPSVAGNDFTFARRRQSTSPFYSWTAYVDDPTNQMTFEVRNNSSTNFRLDGDNALVAGLWYHWAATIDASNNITLYVNGVAQSDTETLTGSLYQSTGSELVIGTINGSSSAPFDGRMDDFRIYQRAFSAKDIESLYEDSGREAGLLGHWLLDETSGTTAADSSGNGYDGTMQNGLDAGTDSVTGVFSNALNFDGSNDYISVANNDVWDLSNSNATFSTWFRADPSQPDPFPRFFDRFTGSGFFGYRFGFDNDGDNLQFAYYGTDNAFITTSGTYNDGQWHHAAVTLDGTTARLYIDGVFDSSDTYSNLNNHSRDLRLGSGASNNNVLNGDLDDMRIYGIALSEAEVVQLFNNGANNLNFGLAGHWKLDETTGTTAADSSENGNDGTVQNTDFDTDSVDAIFDTGLSMDASSNTYIQIADNDVYDVTSYTLSAWVRGDNPSDEAGSSIEKVISKDRNFIMNWDHSTQGGASCEHNNSGWITTGDAPDLAANQWYHLACTYDEITQNFIFYVDGVEVSRATSVGAPSANTDPVLIGRYTLASEQDLDGDLDDVRIYNRALSPALIQALYDTGATTADDSGPIAWWKLDETSGTSATDSTGNGYNGTMAGGLDAGSDSVNGVFDNALDFDGSNDVINTTFSTDGMTQFTITAWVNADSWDGTRGIVGPAGQSILMANSQVSGSTDDWDLRANNASSTQICRVYMPGQITNQWTFVAFKYDGDVCTGFLNTAIYTDDALNGEALGDRPFHIGRGNSSYSDSWWDGSIDDVRVYDRALSDSELLALVNEPPFPPDLVGYWKLDEASGNFFDSSVYGNDGVPEVGVTYSEEGFINDAAGFPGTAGIDVAHDVALDFGTTDFSGCAWTYPTATSGSEEGIFAKYNNNSNPHYALFYDIDPSRLFFRMEDAGGTSYRARADLTNYRNRWTHVCFTVDRDGGATGLKLYINGEEPSSYPVQDDISSAGSIANSYGFGIGIFGESTTGEFTGRIDDVRVYGRTLTASEIQAIYEESGRGANLVGWWKLDETSGTTAEDSSVNGNDGTMDNGLNASTDSVPAVVSNGLDFEGTDDHIDITTSWSDLSTFTYTAWIRPDTWGGSDVARIVHKGNNGTNPMGGSLMICSNNAQDSCQNALRFEMGGTTTNGLWHANNVITLGEWHHVAVSFDKSSVSNSPVLYVNGVLQTLDHTNLVSGAFPADDSLMWIGSRQGLSRHFDGIIDDVRVYNSVLSADEIFAVYACSSGGPGTQFYNATADVMQWCDNTYSARNMYTPASGAGGCVSPVAASEGTLNFVTDRYQGCDGNGWIDIGK